MSDFDPVEIRLDLVQNVDSEGQKSTAAMNDIAAASTKMKAQFEKDIAAQKMLTTQLITELKLLKETMGKKVETGDDKQIVEKQKLAEQIELLNKKLIEQQALLERIGKTPVTTPLPKLNSQVADYARQVNGLKFSMTQISRELPNFAISPMIGIMSLSNNLPMLQGDITRMIELNKQLKASGQATIPVFKQIVSSLFSWQTALIAGISALMLWGPQIGDWISDLFRAKDALRLTKDELKGLNESFAKAAGADLGKLKSQFDALKNAKKGTVEYYDAKKQIVDQYGNYLKGMDSEISSLNNVKGAYQALTVEIMKAAKAKALQETTSNLATKFLTDTEDQYDVIKKNFTGEFGEDLGKMRFDMFKKQLESGGDFTYEMQRYIAEFDTKRQDVIGSSITGAVQYGGKYDFNLIKNKIEEYKKAKNEFDSKVQDAWDRFGNDSQTTPKNSVQVIEDRIQALKTEQKLVSETSKEWDKYQKQIDKLEGEKTAITGKTDKGGKPDSKEVDKIAEARKSLEDAIKSGDQTAIDGAAKVLEKLQNEKDLMDAIADSALAIVTNLSIRGKGPSTVSEAVSEMKKATGLDFSKAGKPPKVFAPEWKKLDGKVKEGEKYKDDIAKKSKEELENEARLRQDIAVYAQQLVDSLTAGLDLTEAQSAALNGAMSAISALGQGDYIGAAISGFSTIVSAVMDTSGIEDKLSKPWEEFENWISRSNDALERYIKLRDEAIGGERYSSTDEAITKAKDIKAEAEAKLSETKLSWTFEDSGWFSDTIGDVQKQFEEKQKELGEGILKQEGGLKTSVLAGYSKSKQVASYDLDQILKDENGDFSLTKLQQLIDDGIVTDQAVIDAVKAYNANADKLIELQKEKQQLLTDTMASSIADSIIDGFKQGYDSAEDFADNFEGLMTDAILNAVKIKALEEPLKKWYDQFALDMESPMANGEAGLDEKEKEALKVWWNDIVAGGIAASDAALDAAGIDINTQSDRTGSTKGIAQASQDSVDELNGRMTAIQQYIYDIRSINQQSFDFDKESRLYEASVLGFLETIAENTDYCKLLVDVKQILGDIQLKGVKIKN